MRSQVKSFGAFVLLLLCPASAWTQSEFGTIVVVFRSEDKIVMAADSRVNYGDGIYDDNHCKIVALGNEIIFAATGIVGEFSSSLPQELRFSAGEEVRRVFSNPWFDSELLDFQGKVAQLASRWGAAMTNRFTRAAPRRLQHWLERMTGDIFIQGIFAGVEPDGHLSLVVTKVTYGRPIAGLERRTATFHLERIVSDSPFLQAFGGTEIFQEFTARSTGRAHREVIQLALDLERYPPELRDALRVIRLVDLTIAFHRRRDSVGGEIDAIEPLRDRTIRWIQRKPQCPAN